MCCHALVKRLVSAFLFGGWGPLQEFLFMDFCDGQIVVVAGFQGQGVNLSFEPRPCHRAVRVGLLKVQ